jgi:hypothetical protein
MLTEEEMYSREASLSMDESEEVFTTEFPLENKSYSWHDKYRPRKPKYYNRIHSGFEWNKYNQTHYDRILIIITIPNNFSSLTSLQMITLHQRLFKATSSM